MRAISAPVIYHCQLGQPHRQLRDDDVLKNSHVRQLVTDFESDVVAEKCIHQFDFFLLGSFHCRYPNIFLNSLSSITGTSSSLALSSFDPGSAPART